MSIIGAAALAAGLIGAGSHISASEKNDKANSIVRNAKRSIEEEQEYLDSYKREMGESLVRLGKCKKEVLDNSIQTFITAYERVKAVELTDSIGINELSGFSIDDKDIIQLQQMENLYSSAVSNTVAGAAAGYFMALAASGSLPLVAGGMSVAGSALAMGDIALAAGIAGSTLSTGALLSPVGIAAGPIMLFTGLSANSKAEANLERAEATRAQSNATIEEMRIKETMCNAIKTRSDMFHDLLTELDSIFAECIDKLNKTTLEIQKRVGDKAITADDVNRDELELIAVTRSLAGAVKAVIDVPLLTEKGALREESLSLYEKSNEVIPYYRKASNRVNKLVCCPSCGERISPRAIKCPKCKHNITQRINN